MSDWNPSKKDIVLVCEHIVDFWVELIQDDYGPDEYQCRHCLSSISKFQGTVEDLKHDSDCPYLIAKDILTGVNSTTQTEN